MGAGGLGLMAVAMLKAMGHRHIAVCEIDARKWPAAQALGAQHVIDPASADAGAQLAALTGGVWGVLDLVGAENTATLGLASLRKGGRYVVVGLYGGQIPVSLVPMAQRAISITGSYVGSPQELREVVELARSGRLAQTPIEVCPADQISAQLDRLKAGQVVGRMVARWD
jgi:D-arabinose 1-dehydrogenase-like Zn-dependent alcohol dehydrogenase